VDAIELKELLDASADLESLLDAIVHDVVNIEA
jgi:hypothetical protein